MKIEGIQALSAPDGWIQPPPGFFRVKLDPQSRQQVRSAYCPNIYTVPGYHFLSSRFLRHELRIE